MSAEIVYNKPRLLGRGFLLGDVFAMDKKAQKKIDALRKRIQNLKQQIAGAKKQMDDPAELKSLDKQLADAEAELAKIRGE
jgi:hypothetical protein